MKKSLVSILMILTMFSLWSCQEKPDSPVNAELQSIEFTNIDGNTLYMREGETFKVNYALEPSELEDEIELQWKTNRKFIVSVEDGKLTAHTEGTAEITAYYGDVSASFTVEVAEYIELKTITMSLSKSSIAIGETSEATLKLNPETASDVDITWEVSPEDIVSISNENKNKSVTLTGLKPGTVTVTAKDVSGLKASKTLTVAEVEITSISISDTRITLCPDGSVSAFGGKNYTLDVSTVPANQEHQLEWISNKPNVATVENGVITAVGHGYAQIQAVAPNGVSSSVCVFSVTNSGADWRWREYDGYDANTIYDYDSPSNLYTSIGHISVQLVDANLTPFDDYVRSFMRDVDVEVSGKFMASFSNMDADYLEVRTDQATSGSVKLTMSYGGSISFNAEAGIKSFSFVDASDENTVVATVQNGGTLTLKASESVVYRVVKNPRTYFKNYNESYTAYVRDFTITPDVTGDFYYNEYYINPNYLDAGNTYKFELSSPGGYAMEVPDPAPYFFVKVVE